MPGYYYTVVLGPENEIIEPIRRIGIGTLRKISKETLPGGQRRKNWSCGDKASEAVYKEQGWFPGP